MLLFRTAGFGPYEIYKNSDKEINIDEKQFDLISPFNINKLNLLKTKEKSNNKTFLSDIANYIGEVIKPLEIFFVNF